MPAFNSRLSSFPIIFLSRSCQDKDRKQMPQTPRLSQYNTCMEESVCDHESDHQVPKLKEAKMMSKIDEDGLEQLTKHLVRGASSETLPSPSSVKGEHSLRWQGLTAHGQRRTQKMHVSSIRSLAGHQHPAVLCSSMTEPNNSLHRWAERKGEPYS